ncbi:MAG: hypothetical protein KAX19_10140 [Candidatus Brocadiae bacterium]|nr:hypothetical protein [Candidatus Brocadiia bacterium]
MLMRAFSKVDDDGRIAVGRNLWRHCGLLGEGEAAYLLVGLKGSSRKEYLFIHRIGFMPTLSVFECVLASGRCRIEDGCVCLGERLSEDTCFVPGSRTEIKLAGSGTLRWLAIRWRGPAVASTLQQRMNVRGLGTKRRNDKWQRMTMGY